MTHEKMQSVATRIIDRVDTTATVEDVRIGLGYTAVMLEDQRTGVAYTFRDRAKVSEGGGMRRFNPHIAKVCWRAKSR